MPQTAHITFSVLKGYLVLLIKILLLQTTLLSQIYSTLAVNIQNGNHSTAVRYSIINITQLSPESENSQLIRKINTINKQTSSFDETGATLKDGEKRLQLKRSNDVEIKNTNNEQLDRTQNDRIEENHFSSKSTAEKKGTRQGRMKRDARNRRQAYESTVVPTSVENYSISDRATRSSEPNGASKLTEQMSTSSSSSSFSGQNLLIRGDNKCSIYAKIEKCINYDQERTVCDWTVESPRCDGLMNYTLFYTKGSSNKGEVFTPYCVIPSGANGESEFKINSDKMDNNRNIDNNRNTNNNRNANDNSDNNNKQNADQNYRLFRNKKNKFWADRKASPKTARQQIKSSKNGQTSKNWAQSRSKNKQSSSKSTKNQKSKGTRKKSFSNSFKPIKPRSAVHDDIYFGEGSRRKKRAATGVQMAVYRGLENSARQRCTFRAEIGHVQHVFFVARNLNDEQKIREPAADDLVFVVTGDENLVVTYPPINLHADAARGTVNLLWEKPNKIIYTFGLVPLLYRVKYRKKPNLNLLALGGETVADWSYQEVKSGETKHEMQDLERGYTYEFQVQATPKESEYSTIEWSESSNTDTAYVKGSGILETVDPAGGEKNTSPNYDTGTIIFPDDNEHLIARPTHMVVTLDQESEEKLSVADVVWMSIAGVIASTFMIMLSYAINHREKLKRTLISRVPEPHILVRLGQDDRGLMPNSKKKKNKKRDSNNRRGTEQFSDSDSSGGNGGAGAFLGGNGSIVQISQGLLPSQSGMTIAHAVASPTQAAVNLMNSGSGANRRHLMIAEQLEQGLMHETNQRNQSQQTQQTTGIAENRNLGTTMQLAGFGQGEQQWDTVRSPLIARESHRNEESIRSGDLRHEQPYALSDVSDIRSSKANSTIYSLANYDSGSGYPAIGNQDNSGGGVYPRIGTSTIIPGGNSGTTMPMTIPAALNPAANQSRYSSRAASEHGNSRPISPFYRGQDFNDRPVSPGSSLVSSSIATSRRTGRDDPHRNMTFMRAELEENYNEMVFREFNEHQFGDQFRNSHFGDKSFTGDRNFKQDRNFGFHSKVYPSNSFNSSESNHSENFWRQAKAAISSDPNITRSSGYHDTNSSASGRSRGNSGARLIQSHMTPLKTSFEEEHESNSSDSTTSYQPRESSSDSRESLDKISVDKISLDEKVIDHSVVIRSPRVKRISSAGSVKSASVKSASVKSASVKSASVKSASVKSTAKSSSLKQKSSLKSVLNKRNSATFSEKDFEIKSEYTTDENSTETEVQIIQKRIIVTERILVARLVTDHTDEETNLRPDGKESEEVCKRNDSWENESQDVLTPLPEECETNNFLQNSACYVASSSPSSSSPSPSSSNSSGSSSNNGSSSEDLSSSTKDSTAKNLTISNSNSQKPSSSKNLKTLSKNYQIPRRSRLNRKMSANSNNSSLSRQIYNSRMSAPLINNVTQNSSSPTLNSQSHSTSRRVLSNRISNSSMDSGFAPEHLLSNRRSFTTRDNSGNIVCPPAPSSGARNEFQPNSEFNQHRTLMAQTSNTTDLGVINDVSSLNSSTEELRKKITQNSDSDSLKKPANVVTQSTRSRIGSFISRRIFGKK